MKTVVCEWVFTQHYLREEKPFVCRSIKQLRRVVDEPVTEEEMTAAARQLVRKVSGYCQSSHTNQLVFDKAIDAITTVTHQLLQNLA